jgi:hypothetical protein
VPLHNAILHSQWIAQRAAVTTSDYYCRNLLGAYQHTQVSVLQGELTWQLKNHSKSLIISLIIYIRNRQNSSQTVHQNHEQIKTIHDDRMPFWSFACQFAVKAAKGNAKSLDGTQRVVVVHGEYVLRYSAELHHDVINCQAPNSIHLRSTLWHWHYIDWQCGNMAKCAMLKQAFSIASLFSLLLMSFEPLINIDLRPGDRLKWEVAPCLVNILACTISYNCLIRIFSTCILPVHD